MEYQHEDYTNHYTNLDQTYNYWFVDDDLMFFDCGLIDHELRSMNKDLVPNTLNIDTVSVSQGLSLCLDDSGGGLLSEGLEGFPKENRDDGDSFVTKTRIRRDRSKTLVSERKRRGRMKEKLYELRSLVPNITKVRSLIPSCILTSIFKQKVLLCIFSIHIVLIFEYLS